MVLIYEDISGSKLYDITYVHRSCNNLHEVERQILKTPSEISVSCLSAVDLIYCESDNLTF